MAREVVEGSFDGNLMVASSFQLNHPNHISSYVENIVFWVFFCQRPWRAAEMTRKQFWVRGRSSAAEMENYSLKCRWEWSWLIGPQGTRPVVNN